MPRADLVQIATLDNGAPVKGPAGSITARQMAAALPSFDGLPVREVRINPDTCTVHVNGDPAFDATGFWFRANAVARAARRGEYEAKGD